MAQISARREQNLETQYDRHSPHFDELAFQIISTLGLFENCIYSNNSMPMAQKEEFVRFVATLTPENISKISLHYNSLESGTLTAYLSDGGKASVFVDGQKMRVDVLAQDGKKFQLPWQTGQESILFSSQSSPKSEFMKFSQV